ncbi:hypothetical protein E3P91_01372 [Wallemia ichthyophaga]|nr:hypothetical protein E3P91_01372 [Wallemia ichthyophaga]
MTMGGTSQTSTEARDSKRSEDATERELVPRLAVNQTSSNKASAGCAGVLQALDLLYWDAADAADAAVVEAREEIIDELIALLNQVMLYIIIVHSSTTEGFNLLFNDKIEESTRELSKHNNAFGKTGLGIILFLQAALGMEDGMMERAQDQLLQAEKAADSAKRECSNAKHNKTRFASAAPYVWLITRTKQQPNSSSQELLVAANVIGQSMTQILTESSVEMIKAIYKLNRSYKLYNNSFLTVFPGGAASLPDTPIASPSLSRQQSTQTLNKPAPPKPQKSFLAKKFGSFLGGAGGGTNTAQITTPQPPSDEVEEFVMSGACFGFGLFGLVFSLMPPKLKKLINVFGFKSDRKEALKALSLSASYKDVHSSFAALTLLFYTSSTLLLAGWNADSENDMRMFEKILKSCEERYPDGTLWTLNRAKLERINGNADKALEILGSTLNKDGGFPQAEVIIVFEYAWLLLAENRYQDSAQYFLHLMKLNSWSHATYTLLAAGCHLSHAQEVPSLLNAKKLGGRNMPMEDFAQRKIAFWKRKHERRVGACAKQGISVDPERWDLAIKISPADEMACFWNSYGKITRHAAIKHMESLCQLTPAPLIETHLVDMTKAEGSAGAGAGTMEDLDTLDEKAVRCLLLGILHRAIGELALSRRYLDECVSYRGQITDDTWAPAFAAYELAVLELNECDRLTAKSRSDSGTPDSSAASFSTAREGEDAEGEKAEKAETDEKTVEPSNAKTSKDIWKRGIDASEKHLALVASGEFGTTYDLEGRQGTRMYLLKDEIQTKKAQMEL